MSSITVHNLRTGETLTFAELSPEMGVVTAHERARGNYDSESYAALLPTVARGRVSVNIGDFAARCTGTAALPESHSN